jgi:hypothetical protein
MQILLNGNSGKSVIIDDEDWPKVSSYKWYLHSAGYAVRTYMKDRKNYAIYMHREIMGSAQNIDHINGNKLDNRKDNLRICTQKENTWNNGVSTANTSGYKGVYWNKQRNKWAAKINRHGKQIHIGLFDTPEEAAKAYNAKASQTSSGFERLNVLD